MLTVLYLPDNAHRYVTLYMNPDTMDVKETMFIPSTTSAIGKLCPNMRRVPQMVSVSASLYPIDNHC